MPAQRPNTPASPRVSRRRFVAGGAACALAAGVGAEAAAAWAREPSLLDLLVSALLPSGPDSASSASDTADALDTGNAPDAGSASDAADVSTDGASSTAETDDETWYLIYRVLRAAADTRRDSLELRVHLEDANLAVHALEYDPEAFYLLHQPKLYYYSDTHVIVEFEYRYTLEEAAEVLAACERTAEELLAPVPRDTDAWTRALMVHDILCGHMRSPDESAGYLDEDGVLRYDDVYRRLDTALLDGIGVCQGYAVAYQYLLQKVGVSADVVVSADHAWNTVSVDGELYHVDATYDNLDQINPWGNEYISHARFMMNDDDLAAHGLVVSTDETRCGPSTGTSQNYYVRMGYVLEEYSHEALLELWRGQVAAGSDVLSVRFARAADYEALLAELRGGLSGLVSLVGEASDWMLFPSFYIENDGMRTFDLFLAVR